jgi:hypothetical protein
VLCMIFGLTWRTCNVAKFIAWTNHLTVPVKARLAKTKLTR